ncbi:MAG TPA: zinc ribbon domain-containing protein [Anaerolineales bacterium]|jgi:putative FmdB family regulatory protein|nr:zinc ribbon domain-containing protein [Anaerolineales bacterium]|tara:strand:- start:300 stop:545 length:246 start_codon:yes stop_codon:yes gene_type:complete
MPLYEYFCSDCRTHFDELRPMANADDSILCPDCSGQQVMRTLSMFFSGSASGKESAAPVAGNGASGGCCGGMCACGGHSPN